MAQNGRNNKKKRRFSRTNKRRLVVVFVFVLGCFLLLILRLIQINATKGETYEKNVFSMLNYDGQTIPYKRGDIKDRNGTVLATSEKIYNLVLDPYVIMKNQETNGATVDDTVFVLKRYFGLDEEKIRDILRQQSESRYVVLKRKLTYDDKKEYDAFLASENEADQEIASIVSSGIWFEENYRRVYPYSTLACDVIGFTSDDYTGLWGLENYYEEELSGTNGRAYGYLDDSINLQTEKQNAKNGSNLISTIDINIQRICEKYLDQFMTAVGAKNIAAIVMNPNNGEILAMASAPVFDLNDPSDLTAAGYKKEEIDKMSDQDIGDLLAGSEGIWRNFCVNDAFEPGSTAKTMTVAYAIDQAAANNGSNYECDGGQLYDADNTWVSCNDYHGKLTLTESIMYSCNDVMMQIADKLGVESFVKMQRLFGMGQDTGIDLPGEATCDTLLFTEENMGPVELWTSSFGQGFESNMVQIASAFASIVNGGYYYKPHIVSSLESDNGSTVEVYDKTLVRKTVSKQTSEWMRDALYKTVQDGTGHYAQVEGYKIGGKTGTAEKLPRGTKARLVSFIGAAPIDDPQLVVYVIVDEANTEDQGQSAFACDIAARIFREALPYLQIFPTEEISEDQTVVDIYTDKGIVNKEKEKKDGEDAEVSEDGEVKENEGTDASEGSEENKEDTSEQTPSEEEKPSDDEASDDSDDDSDNDSDSDSNEDDSYDDASSDDEEDDYDDDEEVDDGYGEDEDD